MDRRTLLAGYAGGQCDSRGVGLDEQDSSSTDLSGICLAGAGLRRVRLCGASLARADLGQVCARATDLSGARLLLANLAGSELCWAYLAWADLCEASLRRARSSARGWHGWPFGPPFCGVPNCPLSPAYPAFASVLCVLDPRGESL